MLRPLLCTLGIGLILFGLTGFYMLPKVINQKVEQKLQLKIGTKMFDRFQNIPIALKVKFYFFNITNKDEVLSGLERPKFQEVGPFMFEQRRKRHVVDIEDNGKKLRFRESKFYYQTYDKSRQDLDESQMGLDPTAYNITMINLPLLSILTKLAELPEESLRRSLAAKVAQKLVGDGQDKILVTRSASEFLFDGYKVDFMEAARLLFESLGYNFQSPLPANKFGFFFLKNGTWNKNENGELLIYTGRHGSMADFPRIDSWNDQKVLQVWPNNTRAGDRCNRVQGTDGSSFHPNLSRNKPLTVFSPLICTSIHFRYREDTQVQGIPVWRYTSPSDTFAAPGKTERNACYCTIKQPQSVDPIADTNGSPMVSNGHHQAAAINTTRCFIDGILDLSLCKKGAPIAVSGAHFYNADPMLAMSSGLSPDKARHETYLDVEPMTGAVMRAASRAQMNAFVEEAAMNVIDANVTGRMTPMIAPLLWLEEAAEINDKLAGEFKGQLLTLVQKANRYFHYAIILGAIIIGLVAIHYWYCICYRIDKRPITSANQRRKERLAAERRKRGHLRNNLQLDFNDQDQVYRPKKDSPVTNLSDYAGTAAIATATGAIGAELPLTESDKHRLIDDDEDDVDEAANLGRDQPKRSLIDESRPSTSKEGQ